MCGTTFLTHLGESGCDVWTLARIAGHSEDGSQTLFHRPRLPSTALRRRCIYSADKLLTEDDASLAKEIPSQ